MMSFPLPPALQVVAEFLVRLFAQKPDPTDPGSYVVSVVCDGQVTRVAR